MTCNKRHHLVNIESTTIASCLWKFVTSRAINFHSFNIKVCWGIKTEINFSRGKKLYNRGAKLYSVSFNLLNWKTLYMILCHGRNYSFCLSMMSTVILENSVRNVITMLWTNKIFWTVRFNHITTNHKLLFQPINIFSHWSEVWKSIENLRALCTTSRR